MHADKKKYAYQKWKPGAGRGKLGAAARPLMLLGWIGCGQILWQSWDTGASTEPRP